MDIYNAVSSVNNGLYQRYSSVQSISYEKYVKLKGLGGGGIWELSQDPNRVLFNTLYKELQ